MQSLRILTAQKYVKQFKRFFAFLFILSLFVGVVHQLNHTHHTGDVCEVCLLAHSPALVTEPLVVSTLVTTFEPFASPNRLEPTQPLLFIRNRSPPIS